MSTPQSLVLCNALPPVANCDHNSLLTRIMLPFRSRSPKQPSKRVWITRPPTSSWGRGCCRTFLWSVLLKIFLTKWSPIFMSAMHRCIPCKTVPINSNTPRINHEIGSSIKKRRSLYHRFKHSKCHNWLVKYRSLRNSIVNRIHQPKKDFFIKLANSTSDPKAFWATIRKLQPRTSSPSFPMDLLLLHQI